MSASGIAARNTEVIERAFDIEGRSLWTDARRRLVKNRAALASIIDLPVIALLAIVVPATDSGSGKAQTTDDGSLTCTDDAAVIVGDDTLTTCNESGCKGSKIAPAGSKESLTAIDGVVVRVSAPSGLLVVQWENDGKSIAKKVYDAQMKGPLLLGESKLGSAALVSRRGYGLLVVDLGGTQHVARIDAAGGIAATSFKP